MYKVVSPGVLFEPDHVRSFKTLNAARKYFNKLYKPHATLKGPDGSIIDSRTTN